MAKRQRDLDKEGWTLLIEEHESLPSAEPLTPTRRTRRRGNSSEPSYVKLERQEDGLRIQTGDCLLISGDQSSIFMITSIKLGLKALVELLGAQFMHPSMLSEDAKKGEVFERNEILITPEIVSLHVKDIVDKVQVLTSTEYSEVVLDDSSASNLFLCQRASDFRGERLSETFDFSNLRALIVKDYMAGINFIAENTSDAQLAP